jgi:L-ascorbate metabolism protein UlaG (beta-lactamase superfamily)
MKYKDLDIKWLGHSGFKIISSIGKVVYIDPYKISEDNEIADIIFITHSHYDHCSIEDLNKIVSDGTIIICPPDVSSKMTHIKRKIKLKITEVGDSEELEEENLKFWAIPAYNINKNFHPREEDWLGYIIQIGEVLIYHAGDSDFIPEMKNLENIDIAMIPIGGTYTMNAGEAAKAVSIIKPKIAIPMHYGTVQGIGDKSDADTFAKLAGSEEVEVKVLVRS